MGADRRVECGYFGVPATQLDAARLPLSKIRNRHTMRKASPNRTVVLDF